MNYELFGFAVVHFVLFVLRTLLIIPMRDSANSPLLGVASRYVAHPVISTGAKRSGEIPCRYPCPVFPPD
jgi:hypothetical protein